MILEDHIKQLEQKNKALSQQLDKITEQLYAAQEIATDLKNQLDEKKHSEQLAGWAIDRALETAKLHPNEDIIATAQKYCDWIMESACHAVQKIVRKKTAH